MTLAEQIQYQLNDLPPEKQIEVLDFIAFLRQRAQAALSESAQAERRTRLKKAFETLGYIVTAVVPGFVLGPEPQAEITAESCRVIYKKMDQITAESFTGLTDASASFKQKKDFILKRYQLPIIILSLVALLLLVIVVPLTLKTPTPPKKKPVSPHSRPTVVVSPSVTPLPSTPSAEILNNFKTQILNGSGKIGQAASLSAKFTSSGLTDVQTGNSPQTSEETLIIFSPTAASSAGEFISDLVKDIYPKATISTDEKAKFDITVIIGKNTP